MREQVRSNPGGAAMSIEIHCQNCDKRYRVKAELAGKRVRCSNCGSPVTVPNGQGNHGNGNDAAEEMFDAPPQPKRPGAASPKSAPPPVPKQVVRHDPRFDPQAMTDFPAPPPPSAPMPKQGTKRAPQAARQ